ncbi:hypothetical protein Y10_04160 [Neptunitalea sp. Y10]|uniref:BD-FAE-like domain-containing protein n=2 Tax=Neptunitalea lumnitzerae TaxID=2965509 RepID=A0ABQ5MF94_9FLAO|nr:hypothetical protein Y10_04160 [Neptunitalea sp. Y10]
MVTTIVSLCSCKNSYSQDEHKVLPPYNIESTYQKLKNKYPSISPVHLIDTTLTIKKDIVYHKTSTSKLFFDVYFPEITKKTEVFPVVLLVHGGGWIVGSKKNQHPMAQQLALNGYVAIPVSYTLSEEATYPAAVIDLKHAIQYIREHASSLHADPNRIAILGASAGAQLATLVGVTPNNTIYRTQSNTSDAVQAIVNVDGIVSFTHPESEEGTIAGQWLGGTKSENIKNWEEASPLNYVSKSTPPILFLNSSRPRFHAGRDDMITQMNAYDIYSEVHTFSDAPHSFWLLNPWFTPTVFYVIKFLDKTLKHSS